ncbi:MAG: DUF805 domain-containing protein [Cellvibrionaceae bacterium]
MHSMKDSCHSTCCRPRIFSFQERIDAWRFFAYFLIYTLLYAVVILVSAYILIPLFSSRPDLNLTALPILTILLLYALSFLPQHIPARRRLHDMGIHGKWSLLLIPPVINIFFVGYLLFAKGDVLDNRFGKPPCPASRRIKVFCLLMPVLIVFAVREGIKMWKAAI